ncbi:hypothetical protein D3C73_1307040 [compost metagenome]
MVIGRAALRQQVGEFIEGCDFGRACPRELLAHESNVLIACLRAHLFDHSGSVIDGGGRRVDVEYEHARNVRHCYRLIAQSYAEHLIKIRSRVCANEKHLLACISQCD